MNVNKICNFSLETPMELNSSFILCNLLMESLVINFVFHVSVLVIFGIYLMKNNEKVKKERDII